MKMVNKLDLGKKVKFCGYTIKWDKSDGWVYFLKENDDWASLFHADDLDELQEELDATRCSRKNGGELKLYQYGKRD